LSGKNNHSDDEDEAISRVMSTYIGYVEKRNWRARRKAHEKRVKQRGDNFDSDSLDSEESQATLLLEQVQSELLLAKNELKLLELSIPKEDAPVPANGNE
jgi:hypothetical protein